MPQPNPVQIGYLDKNGHPTVKIKVHGIVADAAVEFEAMIDTGFTGFLLMPLVSAFPLTLTLMGTSSYTLADGSSSPKLLAWGTVTLADEKTNGTIVLEPNNCGILLGMDFLRKAKRALIVHEGGVALVHDDFVREVREAVAAARNKGQTTSETK